MVTADGRLGADWALLRKLLPAEEDKNRLIVTEKNFKQLDLYIYLSILSGFKDKQ